MRFKLSFTTVMLLTLSTLAAPATAPSQEAKVETVTRVYDISDLLWTKTDYPAPGSGAANGNSGGGGGSPGVYGGTQNPNDKAASQELVDNVTKLLTDTVDSDSWKDNGGTVGALRELSGQLIVTQTADAHRQINDILKALRADRGRMVVIHAYWLLLEPSAVPAVRKSAGGKELPVIEDKLVDAQHLYCAAQTMCFSGQTVHVVSGRNRAVVTSLTPVVANSAVGYQPTIGEARSGVVLQVTPHLEPESPDARVVIDIQSNVNEVGNLNGDRIEFPATTQPSDTLKPGDTLNAIDRLNEINQELRTTVRLPMSQKVLVGGMTLEPAAKDNAARQLYLVIEADSVK